MLPTNPYRCAWCDGTGEDDAGYACVYCDGTGDISQGRLIYSHTATFRIACEVAAKVYVASLRRTVASIATRLGIRHEQ